MEGRAEAEHSAVTFRQHREEMLTLMETLRQRTEGLAQREQLAANGEEELEKQRQRMLEQQRILQARRKQLEAEQEQVVPQTPYSSPDLTLPATFTRVSSCAEKHSRRRRP